MLQQALAEQKQSVRRRSRTWVWLPLLAFGIAGGVAYANWPQVVAHFPALARLAPTSLNGNQAEHAGAHEVRPPPVHARLVGRQDFPVYLNGLGTAQAWTSVIVRSRVDGQVTKIAFEEGQMVREGDTLVELDARPFQAALDQAKAKVAQDKASLTSARADLARTKSLIGNGYATKQLFDQQTGAVNQLQALIEADEAALENARVQLSYTTIKAPISGRLGLRYVDVGNIVHATDTNGVVTIAEIHPISVLFTAPENELPQINKSLKAGPLQLTAFSPDGKTELGRGELSIVNNDIDITSGTIRLKGKFDNPDNTLWPGMSVTTKLHVRTLHDVIVVPDSAVQRGPLGLYAYVVRADHKIEKRRVAIGQSGGGLTVVDSGLQVGDEVVTQGHYRAQPGSLVSVEHENGEKTANTHGEPRTQ